MHPGSRCVAISQDTNSNTDDRVYDNGDINTTEDIVVSTEVDNGEIYGNTASFNCYDDDGVDNDSDANEQGATKFTSTTFERGGQDGNATIDRSYRVYSLTWEDVNGQKQQIYPQDEVILQIYMNTLANTAFFKLYTNVALQRSRRYHRKERVYLHIYPEWIKAITSQITSNERKGSMALANHSSLHFSLTQHPDLIAPKDIPLVSKGKAKAHLKLFQDLATLTQFTVDLASSSTTARNKSNFQLLTTIFSSKNKSHPCKYSKLGNIALLYAGNGGKVVGINADYADVDSLPPLYTSEHFLIMYIFSQWS